MSVTFRPNLPISRCDACGGAGFTGDYNLGTDVDCALCGGTGAGRDAAPEVNLANVNAADLLAALGYDADDLYGEAEAEDFLGRVLLRIGLPADEPVPTVETRGALGARFVSRGRPEGALQGYCERLVAVAEAARRAGAVVTWG